MRFEKSQDPANTVRGLARAVELLQELSPGIRLVGGLADQQQRNPAAAAHPTAARLAGAQAGPRDRARRSARHSGAPGVRRRRTAAGRLLRDRALLARHQGHLDQGRPGGRGRPHGRATIPSRRSAPAGACHRAAGQSASASSSTRSATCSSTRASPRSTTIRSSARNARAFGMDPARPRARGQSHRVRPGADAHFAAARHLRATSLENTKHLDAFRLFEIGREIHKQPHGLPRRDSAPGRGDLRPARRRRRRPVRTEARGRMPDAGRAGRARRGARHTSIPRARRKSHWQRRSSSAGSSNCIPRWSNRPRRHARSGSARWSSAVERRRERSTRRFAAIPRAPSISRWSPALREHAGRLARASSRRSPGRCSNPSNIVRQYAGPPLAEGTKSVSFRADGRLARAHALVGRSGRDPRRASSMACAGWATNCACEHPPRQARRMGRAARSAARAAGAAARSRRAASPSAATPACTNGSCAPTPAICANRFSPAIAAYARNAASDTEALRKDKRKLDYRARRQFEKDWGGRRHLWDADHIVPVVEGGGECDLANMRTLCLQVPSRRHRRATDAPGPTCTLMASRRFSKESDAACRAAPARRAPQGEGGAPDAALSPRRKRPSRG